MVDGLAYYMGEGLFNYREFCANLAAKLENADFAADLDQLTAEPPHQYSVLPDGGLDPMRFRLLCGVGRGGYCAEGEVWWDAEGKPYVVMPTEETA